MPFKIILKYCFKSTCVIVAFWDAQKRIILLPPEGVWQMKNDKLKMKNENTPRQSVALPPLSRGDK